MAQVNFYTFIATMVYLFCISALVFHIFYKIAIISPHKGMKNFFLFLMSLLLRIPFKPVEDVGHTRISFGIIWREIRKDVWIVFFVTLWYVTGLYFADTQIEDFKGP
ncbi:hypothetical protein [Halobacillus sp. Nhm2S1]|uniref:hypothetical protein n=1 Tax=Halobacillus sp. Nhm2S1 TaxID=2866716 RepID=UPI001C732FD6|nr:hypothetical protein [Halobacillus sp. Nhm2S1]MBX0356635.1 hypothetical protein [Halobacillus sp. Nhm2S1]